MDTTKNKTAGRRISVAKLFTIWRTLQAKYADTLVLVGHEEMYLTFGKNAILLKEIVNSELVSYRQVNYNIVFRGMK